MKHLKKDWYKRNDKRSSAPTSAPVRDGVASQSASASPSAAATSATGGFAVGALHELGKASKDVAQAFKNWFEVFRETPTGKAFGLDKSKPNDPETFARTFARFVHARTIGGVANAIIDRQKNPLHDNFQLNRAQSAGNAAINTLATTGSPVAAAIAGLTSWLNSNTERRNKIHAADVTFRQNALNIRRNVEENKSDWSFEQIQSTLSRPERIRNYELRAAQIRGKAPMSADYLLPPKSPEELQRERQREALDKATSAIKAFGEALSATSVTVRTFATVGGIVGKLVKNAFHPKKEASQERTTTPVPDTATAPAKPKPGQASRRAAEEKDKGESNLPLRYATDTRKAKPGDPPILPGSLHPQRHLLPGQASRRFKSGQEFIDHMKSGGRPPEGGVVYSSELDADFYDAHIDEINAAFAAAEEAEEKAKEPPFPLGGPRFPMPKSHVSLFDPDATDKGLDADAFKKGIVTAKSLESLDSAQYYAKIGYSALKNSQHNELNSYARAKQDAIDWVKRALSPEDYENRAAQARERLGLDENAELTWKDYNRTKDLWHVKRANEYLFTDPRGTSYYKDPGTGRQTVSATTTITPFEDVAENSKADADSLMQKIRNGVFRATDTETLGAAINLLRPHYQDDRNFKALEDTYLSQEGRAGKYDLKAFQERNDIGQVMGAYTDASRTSDAMSRQGFFIGAQVDVQDVNKDILAEVRKIVPILQEQAKKFVATTPENFMANTNLM